MILSAQTDQLSHSDTVVDISHKRHIAKAVTWRVLGTLDTIILSWIITGNPFTGLKIGAVEIVSKMLLYYLHERAWFRLNSRLTKNKDSRGRHLAKTITWRIVGTLDTLVLAWLITGSPTLGIQISLVEALSKMILYYVHERLWYKTDYGLVERRTINKKDEQ